MNTYSLGFTDFDQQDERHPRGRHVDLGTRQARTARAALEAFVAEKGVAEHYTHFTRDYASGLGCPTLHARKVNR